MRRRKNPKREEFESHTKVFGSTYLKKFDFANRKGLGKHEQGSKDPIPFIKNNHTRGVGTRNVVHEMKQLGDKVDDKQLKYNTPIKFGMIGKEIGRRDTRLTAVGRPRACGRVGGVCGEKTSGFSKNNF
jgi:hypothetical protein